MAEKVDPIHLLGESISFGRYMSERLDWEKWSVFSHNRYVEEAERFSKPGSVAEKKAYFEAHYKRKAAQKAAEADGLVDETSGSETQDGNCNDSYSQMDFKENSDVNVIEQDVKYDVSYADRNQDKHDIQQIEALTSKADGLVSETSDSETQDGNCYDSCSQMNFKENSDVNVIEQDVKYDVSYADTNEDKHDIQQTEALTYKVELHEDKPQPVVDNSNQFDSVEKVAASNVAKLRDPGNPGKATAREVKSSPKSSTKVTISKPLFSERKAIVQPRSRISSVPNNQKDVRGSAEKKRPSTRSLHMSINLPSCAGETSKTASVPQLNITRKISLNSSNVSRGQPVASQTSVRAICGLFNRSSVNSSQSEGRRTERLLNKSVCKEVTASAEPSSTSVVCPKSPSTRRPQSSTIPSPFRFRSEGRVAKRKEFFQRIGEIKLKEIERMLLQRKSKDKTERDHKKLQHCSGFKPKQEEDKNGRLHLPSNEMKKTSPHIQPQSPKPTSSTCHGKNTRNSWKPPTSTTSTPKCVTEKINQTMRESSMSLLKKVRQENAPPLSKKVRQENAPPNIQP